MKKEEGKVEGRDCYMRLIWSFKVRGREDWRKKGVRFFRGYMFFVVKILVYEMCIFRFVFGFLWNEKGGINSFEVIFRVFFIYFFLM